MWLVEYVYKMINTGWGIVKILDKALAVYLVPSFTSDGKLDYWFEVDDSPYDGVGYLESVYSQLYIKGYTVYNNLPSATGVGYKVTAATITDYSGSSGSQFDIAIPVGAIALSIASELGTPIPWPVTAVATLTIGVSVDNYSREFFINLADVAFRTKEVVTFYPRYLQIYKAYVVYEAGRKEFKIPFMIVRPWVV